MQVYDAVKDSELAAIWEVVPSASPPTSPPPAPVVDTPDDDTGGDYTAFNSTSNDTTADGATSSTPSDSAPTDTAATDAPTDSPPPSPALGSPPPGAPPPGAPAPSGPPPPTPPPEYTLPTKLQRLSFAPNIQVIPDRKRGTFTYRLTMRTHAHLMRNLSQGLASVVQVRVSVMRPGACTRLGSVTGAGAHLT